MERLRVDHRRSSVKVDATTFAQVSSPLTSMPARPDADYSEVCKVYENRTTNSFKQPRDSEADLPRVKKRRTMDADDKSCKSKLKFRAISFRAI